MNIAFVVDRFPALSETFVLNQVTGLIDRGHSVEILARSGSEKITHPEVEAYSLRSKTHLWPSIPATAGSRWLKGVKLLGRLAVRSPGAAMRALDAQSYGRDALNMNLAYAASAATGAYDIIQCHFGNNGILAMGLREMGLLHGPIVTAFHGFDLSLDLKRRGRDVYSRLFRRTDFFMPVTERWRRRLIELGCPADRIAVHRAGIDWNRFGFSERRRLPGETLRLASVGRLVEKKGFAYAIGAVAHLARMGHQIEYTIVGDGPLADALAGAVRASGLEGVVQMTGGLPQPGVARVLRSAHILVAPSVTASDGDEEGLPVVLMEAMSTGLLVVATNHSGIPELVEDGVSGMLVPERDSGALAFAVDQLARKPESWGALGRAGRNAVVMQHDIAKLNDTLVRTYETVHRRWSRKGETK